MKRFTAIISTLAVVASLTGCNKTETPTQNASENQSSSQSSTPSHESTVSQDSTSSEESTSSENTSSIEPYVPLKERDYELKGEDLITKFEWPYDAPIELEGMTAQKLTATHEGEVYDNIEISELSNDFEFRWEVKCDYGYLAMAPENGDNFEFKKYKKGDKIGDFTVKEINTRFSNIEWFSDYDYFLGIMASFDGEITLTGDLIQLGRLDDYLGDEIIFYPDEESCKKLPIVNFSPLIKKDYNTKYPYPPKVYVLRISLGTETDYPEIDFKDIPTYDTHVKAKIKIKDYRYRGISGSEFIGIATIADSELELL